MLIAVIAGVAAGIIGFTPLTLAKALARSRNEVIRQNSIIYGVMLVMASLLFLLVVMVVVSKLVPEYFLGFGIAMVAAFLVASLLFAFVSMRR